MSLEGLPGKDKQSAEADVRVEKLVINTIIVRPFGSTYNPQKNKLPHFLSFSETCLDSTSVVKKLLEMAH